MIALMYVMDDTGKWVKVQGDAQGRQVVSISSLPAGVNNIGDVDVLTLPPLPAGANTIGRTDQGAPAVEANAWPTKRTGSNAQVFDGSAAFANSAAAGTIVNLAVPLPASLQGDALYLVTVTNPSTDTALTVRVRNVETLNAVVRYPELTSFAVAINAPDGKSVLVQGWMLGEAGRLSISNDTVLGIAGAFSAFVRVRKV